MSAYQCNCALGCVWMFSDHHKGMTGVWHIHVCIFTLILETRDNFTCLYFSALKEIRD